MSRFSEKKKKHLALLMCVFCILTILLSITFIFAFSEHECTGLDCPVCRQLNSASNAINQIGAAFVFISATLQFGLRVKIQNVFELKGRFLRNPTLVILKVQMNN